MSSFSAQQAKPGVRTPASWLRTTHSHTDGAGQGGAVPSWGGVWRTTRGHWPWLDGCAGLSWLPPALEREAGAPRRGERGRQGRRGGEAWAPWSVPGPGLGTTRPVLTDAYADDCQQVAPGRSAPTPQAQLCPVPSPGFPGPPPYGAVVGFFCTCVNLKGILR